jgi:hypothetical protein
MLELFYHGLVFGLFAILGLLLLFLWRTVYDQQFDFHLWAVQGRRSAVRHEFSPKALELIDQLYQMLQGDGETFESLLSDQYIKHPDRSDVWVLEKCIRDLERDRRP